MARFIVVLLACVLGFSGAVQAHAASAPTRNASKFTAAMNASGQASGDVTPTMITSVEGITEYRLPNGLRILLAPNAAVPRTTVNITYLVGSRDEGRGEAGMAHLLEHMTFKGTDTLTASGLREEFARRGMSANGTTSVDRTNYYATFPSSDDNLDWILRMEAGRMVKSRIDAVDLSSEMPVVLNEMEIGQTKPLRALLLALNATAYEWHPYGKATIGTRGDLENVSAPLLRAFYQRYYQPDNAVLVVGGKFDPAGVLAKISRYFGPIPRPARVLTTAVTTEPAQQGERLVTLLRTDDTQVIAEMYHVPQAAHPDIVTMWLLLQVLATPPGGRLYKTLVDAKKAVSAEASMDAMRDPGSVLFLAEVPKGQSPQLAREAMLEQIEGLAAHPVTAAEFERVRVQARNVIEEVFTDPDRFTIELSEAIAWGDWRLLFLLRDRVEHARVEDLQRVGLQYLRRANRTEGRLIPVDEAQRVEMPAPVDLGRLLDGYHGKAVAPPPPPFDPSPENVDAHTQRFTLGNGMRLAMLSRPTRGDTVTGVMLLRMGTLDSLNGRSATARLTADTLTRGARGLDRQQLADTLAKLKATIQITAQAELATVHFETRRDHLAAFLRVLRDILREPALDAAELDNVKRARIAEVERSGTIPSVLASITMARHGNPYPPGDPRHVPDQKAYIGSLDAVRVDDIRDFHRRFYGASHAQLALVGDFDANAAQSQITKLFGDWTAIDAYTRVDRPYLPIAPAALTVLTANNASAVYLARIPMNVTTDSPEYGELAIANRVYGGNPLRGRLTDRLRQHDGISYSAGSALEVSSLDTAGAFTMQASYAPRNLERVKRAVTEELTRFARDGVTEQELADAKSGLLELGAMGRTLDDGLAHNLANQLFLGRTMAFTAEQEQHVRAATVPSVNAAIRKYIEPKRVVNVFAGDLRPEGIDRARARK